jgi:FtsP/CotA-like multicopper oxidase with cupredoxin domain
VIARAGTYERWYVANVGNSQPLRGDDPGTEMHPFHIHMVNVVVTKRWALSGDAVGGFVELVSAAADLDGTARQDTVLVPSGQLVELLVFYPPGITGDFTFHCHLLEHEDFCMMSHYHVTA